MKRLLLYILIFASTALLAQDGIELYTQAMKLAKQGQYSQAAKKITQALNYFSDDYILQQATELNILAGKYDRAKEIAKKTSTPLQYLELAKIYTAQGVYDSAYAFLTKYLSSKDKLPQYKIKNDTLLRPLAGTQWWNKIWSKQWYDSLYIELDRLAVEARYGDNAMAIEKLSRLAKQQPNNERVFQLLAESYQRLGTIGIAINQMHKALEINPKDYDALVNLAGLYAKKNDYQDAWETLNRAYRLRPYNIDLLPQIADYLTRTANFDRATAVLKKYLAYDDNPQVRYQLAETYYTQGDYLSSIRTINTLLKTDKNNYKYLTLRGKSYLHTNNYQGAYYDLTMSLDLNPNQPEVYRLIGQAAYFIGHTEEACLYWQRSYETFHDKQSLEMLNKTCKKH